MSGMCGGSVIGCVWWDYAINIHTIYSRISSRISLNMGVESCTYCTNKQKIYRAYTEHTFVIMYP